MSKELEVRVYELERENELLRGAMSAQDEREKAAGKRCGVNYELWGCDWPDGCAEEVLALRNRVLELEKEC